jgi:hypothetical protein
VAKLVHQGGMIHFSNIEGFVIKGIWSVKLVSVSARAMTGL